MALGITPLDFFSINDFKPVTSWEIANGAATTVYFTLTKTDSMGTRRFIPVGSTVQLAFLRARAATINSTALTITKACVNVSPDDKSMFSCVLTLDDTTNIISGSAQLVVTTGASVQKVNVPYAVKKVQSAPGF